MKALEDFNRARNTLLEEVNKVSEDNGKLACALESQRKLTQRLHRKLKAREAKNATTLSEWKQRAHDYREKMGQYQRDLAGLRSIVRKQKPE